MNPFLSVIMPVYNGEKFISAALESVRAQYREGIELVIVEGGSSDRTLEIVRDFAKVLPLRLITLGEAGNWVACAKPAEIGPVFFIATTYGSQAGLIDFGVRWTPQKARSSCTMQCL